MAPPSADVIAGTHQELPKFLKQADGVMKRPSAAAMRGNAPKVKLPSPEESSKIASDWLAKFQQALDTKNIDNVLALFHEDAYWKDLLTLEWDHHCKKDKSKIKEWLLKDEKLWKRQVKNVKMEQGTAAALEAMPGLVWIMAFYDFETAIARGRGCIRLQQDTSSKEWKVSSALSHR